MASRIRHSDEYKAEALKLAEKVGVGPAAEQRQQVENVCLKRRLAEREEELAILKKAAAYFAKNQK